MQAIQLTNKALGIDQEAEAAAEAEAGGASGSGGGGGGVASRVVEQMQSQGMGAVHATDYEEYTTVCNNTGRQLWAGSWHTCWLASGRPLPKEHCEAARLAGWLAGLLAGWLAKQARCARQLRAAIFCNSAPPSCRLRKAARGGAAVPAVRTLQGGL